MSIALVSGIVDITGVSDTSNDTEVSPLHFNVQLLPAGQGQEAILRDLFLCSRPEAEQVLYQTHPMGEMILEIQWKARQQAYAHRFPRIGELEIWLIHTRDAGTAGSLMVHRGEKAFRLVDIVLLPELRSQGLGTVLIRRLQSEARLAKLPLYLSVTRNSPARRLYAKLGFHTVSMTETDIEMVWQDPVRSMPDLL